MKKLSMFGVIFGAAVLCAAPVSVQWSPAKTLTLSLDRADARVGRPLTRERGWRKPARASTRVLWRWGLPPLLSLRIL